MNFSKEMIEKSKTASSAENLLEMAKAAGIELSAADAEAYFSFLKGGEQLSDDELKMVAGGKGSYDPKYKYQIGKRLWVYFDEEKDWLEVVVYEHLGTIKKGIAIGLGYLVRGVSYCFAEVLLLESVDAWRVRTTKP